MFICLLPLPHCVWHKGFISLSTVICQAALFWRSREEFLRTNLLYLHVYEKTLPQGAGGLSWAGICRALGKWIQSGPDIPCTFSSWYSGFTKVGGSLVENLGPSGVLRFVLWPIGYNHSIIYQACRSACWLNCFRVQWSGANYGVGGQLVRGLSNSLLLTWKRHLIP